MNLLSVPTLPKLSDYFKEGMKGLYYLKKKYSIFDPNTVWVKHQKYPESDQFRIQLTAVFLKLFFHNNGLYDLIEVQDDNGELILLSRANIPHIAQFDADSCKVNNIPFYCMNGGCEINDDNITRSKTVNHVSNYKGKKIQDFEKVFLLSLMLDTYGFGCEDFALKISNEAYYFRLANLGDNFLSLTDKMPKQPDLFSQKLLKLKETLNSDQEVEKIDLALQVLSEYEGNVFLKIFKYLPKEFLNKLSAERVIKAADDILKEASKIDKVIQVLFDRTSHIFDRSIVKDFKGLSLKNAQIPSYSEMESYSYNIESYVKDLIHKHLKNLASLKMCVEVETALKNNDVARIESILASKKIDNDPLCFSFYKYPEQKGMIDLSLLKISKIPKTYNYRNEAAERYNNYWELKDVLIEDCDKSFLDEL